MMLTDIINHKNPKELISSLLSELHENGPTNTQVLEKLSYLKKFHPSVFKEFEEDILTAIGIFYKIKKPSSLYSFMMSGIGKQHKKDYGALLTPVQASIRRAIDDNQYISISAPTSAGKSFSIRQYIEKNSSDTVIIVPSRALIAEYINSMKSIFAEDKNIMITPFIDKVFTSRKLRRIFILTPERTRDLFKIKDLLTIDLFYCDEAQITDEASRGITFDIMIKRIKRYYPNSKIVFTHPFVSNPEAQIIKHDIELDKSFSKSYTHGTVGKISIFKHSNNKYYYFSPYDDKSHWLSKCIEFETDFKSFALNGKHTVLVYTSKSSIYRGDFLNEFKSYIENFEDIKDLKALEIIEEIEYIFGVNRATHKSILTSLLKKGVVIHHGSIPLEARFLIEKFIRDGFANICFATSTLAQGINMPFDIVWLENNRLQGNEKERSLAFKNLIGRAGRLTPNNSFDYGFVYTKNAKLFTTRLNTKYDLKCTSKLKEKTKEGDDLKELIDSIQDGSFDETLNLPLSKKERLSTRRILQLEKEILDIVYRCENIKESIDGADNKSNRETIKHKLNIIYEASLNRSLNEGESAVFDNAIAILFWMLLGKSFKEVTGIRYSYISNKSGNFKGVANFSQPASTLPDLSLNVYPLFRDTLAKDVSYDTVVFDTYDYIDQVISFSLAEVFISSFKIYLDKTSDSRANKIIDFFQYGTSNPIYILLLRYGFPPEMIGDIAPHIQSIDESNIEFKDSITHSSNLIKEVVQWYMP